MFVLNYDAEIDSQNVTFMSIVGRVGLDDTGDTLRFPSDDSRAGHVYVVCK
jgi:hypothetical protein